MIQLYSWSTPNGYKPLVMLEETGMAYDLIPVKLNGEQFKPEFTSINPNGKIPAMIDLAPTSGGEDIVVFESGAILIYLAEKSGQFLPTAAKPRAQVMQWLMFQMAGIGPMFGQYYHFHRSAPEKIAYAMDRYEKEVKRLYGVMNERLGEAEYLAGDYSIADMAVYPWASKPGNFGVSPEDCPHVTRWIEAVGQRDAVRKALNASFS